MCNAASMAAVQSVAESTIPFCHQWTVLGQTDHSWTPRKSLQWQHGGAVPYLRNLPLLSMCAPPRDQGLSACCCSFPCCTAGCGHLNCKPRDRGIKGHQLLEGLPLIIGILAEWHLLHYPRGSTQTSMNTITLLPKLCLCWWSCCTLFPQAQPLHRPRNSFQSLPFLRNGSKAIRTACIMRYALHAYTKYIAHSLCRFNTHLLPSQVKNIHNCKLFREIQYFRGPLPVKEKALQI